MALNDPSVCNDLNLFMKQITENRKLDDRIIHQLNTTIPTKSFSAGVDIEGKCKDLHKEVVALHELRNEAIKNCIKTRAEATKQLIEQKAQDPENFRIRKNLNREQADLRLLQQEIGIEEIVHTRVKTTFYERCREYYNMDYN